jgi:acyl carrier protein
MSEPSLDQRLGQCFQAVFPTLKTADLAAASTETLPDWDSVAQVTLISVVEEEFAVIIPEERYGELISFGAWSACLETLRG